jgi:4-hydroxy-2-oxoheptanedioate aldolase
MRKNRLHEMHAHGELIVNAWLSIPSAYAAEIVCHAGFDAVTVDCQHGMNGFGDALAMLQAISTTECVPLVRPSENDPAQIMRFLDAGAYGIICPMISTADEAERLVAACRYAPLGRRSYGPARAALYGGADYFRCANEEILVLAMIETRRGIDNLPAILKTDGLHGVYVGPNDLAIELGHVPKPEHDEAEVVDSVAEICRTVRAHKLLPGIFCSDGRAAGRRAAEGFGLVTPGNDAMVLRTALGAGVRQARSREA